MQISAALVKELRDRTGAGMMECKKALQNTDGDIEKAIEEMRISGQAKAAKKAGRIAAEGLLGVAESDSSIAMVEVNCETDFVAKAEDFIAFCDDVAKVVLQTQPADLDALLNATLDSGISIEERRKELIAKLGENMNVRRFVLFPCEGGSRGIYKHGTRIGVLVDMQGGSNELAKDIAMHVAASRPLCVSSEQVPPEVLAKEKEILIAQAQESGKPADIIEKMIQGRLNKYLKDITLVGQPFVKDPEQTVEKLLKGAGASVLRFERFEVGEGLEKKSENFADEVKQAAGG